jgi:hypothetical protein
VALSSVTDELVGDGRTAHCFHRSDGDIAIVTELQNQRMKDLEAEHAVLPATNVEELVEAQSVFASF